MFEQIGLAIFGLTAGWLSQDKKEAVRKYAPFFGLASQCFWLTTTFYSEQWGMFIISIFYTLNWIKGLNTYWFSKSQEEKAV